MVTCQSSELDWEVTVELPADFLSLGRGSVTSPQPSTDEGSTSVKLQPELLSLHLDYGSNGHLFKLCTLEVPSSNPELDYTWILAPMGS